MCSFCLIPFARGRERSRRVDDILSEATALAAAGHHELVLTGVNIGQFSQGGVTLAGLIDRLEGIHGIQRIRLSSIEPTTVTDDLLERMGASRKLCPYLHVPLQSGDDAILNAMNRPYDVQAFISLVERATARVPDLTWGTDVMVGFPGESDRAFERTVDMCRQLPFSYFHVARLRAKTLADLSRDKRFAFAERWIGSSVAVLFESGTTEGLRLGTTRHFLRVAVSSETQLANQIHPVIITGASDRWAVGHILN
jgi:threonylcarbamoyladenosine tRNA methylthiotransferase MtaB